MSAQRVKAADAAKDLVAMLQEVGHEQDARVDSAKPTMATLTVRPPGSSRVIMVTVNVIDAWEV